MRIRNVFLLATLAAPLFAATPPKAATEDVPRLLHRQTQELMDAITNGTPKVWERYLDEGMRLTAEDGKVSGKAEIVKDIRPLAAGVSGKIAVIDFHGTVHGKVAVTNYVADEHENYHGQELYCQYRSTDTWLERGGEWRLIASQVLALRTDPPAIALPNEQLESYAGVYALSPDISYEIRVNGGKLEGQRNGRAAEPLLAEAADVLFVPGSPRYRKIFRRDASGHVTGFVERREAWDLVWTRK
jgi:hypothetical protein